MEMKCQFYKAPVTNTTSRQAMNLLEVHKYITHDAAAMQHTATLRDLLERKARGEATDEDVRRYKANHFDFVLFSGLFRSRTDAGLFQHSGLLCLDMDHLGGPEALADLRQQLLQDPCFTTVLLFTSPSGDGMKWVVPIDLTRCPQHLTWFLALEQYVKERYGVAIDRKCSNLSRACFLPHDPGCYIHPSLLSPTPTLPAPREPFDPHSWAARNPQRPADNLQQLTRAISRNREALHPTAAQAAAASDDPAEDIRYYADLCLSRGIDITAGYDNWLRLGFALSDIFGESGRSMYHDLSRLNSGYNPTQCDRQYTQCLRAKGTGVTYRSFFDLLRRAGIDLSKESPNRRQQPDYAPITEEMMEPVRATRAIVPSGTKEEKIEKNAIFDDFDKFVPLGTMAQAAQNPVYTFSDKIGPTDWPGFCQEVVQGQVDAVDKDKMQLAALNIISGLLPDALYSLYDGRRIYAPLYNIFYGGFATRKGDLEACRQLATPLKKEMLRQYEEQKERYEEELAAWENTPKASRGKAPKEPVRKSPLIAANSSASAIYRQLDANGGSGAMYETEGDTLTNMLMKSEYGDYSDLLRKAHHHELCSMIRVSDKIFIEIEKPRLAVLLTCTGSQLPLLLPPSNVANGLASRFLFYALPDSEVKFRNVFEKNDQAMEEVFCEMGKRILTLHHALLDRRERPLQFMLSNLQQEQFIEMFDAILKEQYGMMGNGIQGFVFRLALECYRYSMVLTALRRLSERYGTGQPLFDDDEQALLCDERDFRIATTIIECLVHHTARVYAVLGTQEEDPFAKAPEQPTTEMKRFYQALPGEREFRTSEVLEIGNQLNIPERTAKRILGKLVTTYQVIEHISRGRYIKRRKEVSHE